jgi:hypothetical protein
METFPNNLDVALDALSKGIAAIPVHPGTKVPMVKWKAFQTELPGEELLREWFSVRANIAIVTNAMVLFDCETPEVAELVLNHCGDTPHKLRSGGGGVHLGYRKRKNCELHNQIRIKGEPIDIRTDGGLELIPISETEKGRYEWLGPGLLPVSELPVARIGWTRERKKKIVRSILDPVAVRDRYAAAALRYEAQNVATAEEGTRNTTLNKAAYSLAGLVAAGLLSREAVEAALFEAALAAGLGEREIAATLRSGIIAGLKHPRNV